MVVMATGVKSLNEIFKGARSFKKSCKIWHKTRVNHIEERVGYLNAGILCSNWFKTGSRCNGTLEAFHHRLDVD